MDIHYFIELALDIFFIFIFTYWVKSSFKNKKGISYKALTILLLATKIDYTLERFSGGIYNYIYFILYAIQAVALAVILYGSIKLLWNLIKNFNNDKIKIEY